MFKRILTISSLFAATFSTCFAEFTGHFYIAPTLYYQSIFNSDDTRYEGIAPGASLGYGDAVYPWLNLAAELFATFESVSLNNKAQLGISLKPRYNWGGSVVANLPFDEQVSFLLRLGLLSTKFQKIEVSKTAWQVGAGLVVNMSCNWDFRAEYDYLMYGRIENVGAPRAGMIAVALVYSFG